MNDTGTISQLEDQEIRQIAGRAGRGMGKGYVLCTSSFLREKVKHALKNVNITIEEQETADVVSDNEQAPLPVEDEHSEIYDDSLNRYLKNNEMMIRRAAIYFPFPIVERMKLKVESILKKKIRLTETLKMI